MKPGPTPRRDMEILAILFAASLGIGLSAACGFRVFIPPLFLGIGMRLGWVGIEAGSSWDFIATDLGLIVLALASVFEVGAYYVPWLDNLLDTIASPAAIIAGVLVTGASLDGADPILQWSLALIAGGGVAGTVQVGTVATRAMSTMTTGGLGNPVVSTVEGGACVLCAVLAIFLPLLAVLLALGLTGFGIRYLIRRRQTKAEAAPS